MIPVNRPFLPPKEEYEKYLSEIWESGWVTNMGPLSCQLENKLKDYLKVDNLLFVTSGTIAIQLAIRALGLKGEIITTPFSFVATTSCIVWEGCTPVFVDIDSDTLNIDPRKIEAAITDETSAILATHIYGSPCDVEAIEAIAKKHNLKVIYDGAHAFGIEINGKSVFEYGDISICSLHATKLFHSGEGGLIITREFDLINKMTYMMNFGFNGPEAFAELGINGKNSELHAAMGLAVLPYMEDILEKRKQLTQAYMELLNEVPGHIPLRNPKATVNYQYFPYIFENEEQTLKCIKVLAENDIATRRYFYPSLSRVLPYVNPVKMPISENISKRVLCLPLFYDLTLEDVGRICRIIRTHIKA